MTVSVPTSIAARRLNVSYRRIQQLVAAGKLEATRAGDRGWLRVKLPEKTEPAPHPHEN